MQQWQPGNELKSRPYRIEKVLGEGGFGITYKAKNLPLDIPVVIKTPNSKLQRDRNYPKYVQNFTREARQLAKLGLNPHPHIVRVTNLFQEDNLPCIVMDFIPGESLYDLVQTQGKLSETKAVEYIKQIGSALTVCHKAGIIHRDVHPNNILIRNDNGKAVLIDFGIAGTTQTSRNTHSGNRAFAPWEQLASWEQQNSKTPQVDIYTLAASFYYLVTGEVPIECLARKYNNSELIEPKQLNPSLSGTVNKAILKGMEVLPENRPNSIREWLDLLVAIPKKKDNKEQSSNKREIPATFIPVKEQPVEPVVIPEPSQKNTSIPKINKNNPPGSNVTRRRWLKYAGLSVGAIGVTLIGKGLWNDFGKDRWNNLSQQIGKIDPPKEANNKPSLAEYKFYVITVNDRGEEIKLEEGKAKYFTEDLGNGITLEMVEIPGGTFMMGTEDEEIERLVKKYDNNWLRSEKPRHKVTIPAFYMGKFQVTQAQWKAVAELPQIGIKLGFAPSSFTGDKLPVEYVSWYDAVEFCARLSKHTGKEYRLPSEAEWEYACRAGTTTPFHFGETITSDLANYNGNYTYANEPKGEYRGTTMPVGSFPPNAFRLYDMHGNVWEWCEDSWHENYQAAPNDGGAWISLKNNDNRYRILRGGSWSYYPWGCRSAYRDGINPDVRSDDFGFRLACGGART